MIAQQTSSVLNTTKETGMHDWTGPNRKFATVDCWVYLRELRQNFFEIKYLLDQNGYSQIITSSYH